MTSQFQPFNGRADAKRRDTENLHGVEEGAFNFANEDDYEEEFQRQKVAKAVVAKIKGEERDLKKKLTIQSNRLDNAFGKVQRALALSR